MLAIVPDSDTYFPFDIIEENQAMIVVDVNCAHTLNLLSEVSFKIIL